MHCKSQTKYSQTRADPKISDCTSDLKQWAANAALGTRDRLGISFSEHWRYPQTSLWFLPELQAMQHTKSVDFEGGSPRSPPCSPHYVFPSLSGEARDVGSHMEVLFFSAQFSFLPIFQTEWNSMVCFLHFEAILWFLFVYIPKCFNSYDEVKMLALVDVPVSFPTAWLDLDPQANKLISSFLIHTFLCLYF